MWSVNDFHTEIDCLGLIDYKHNTGETYEASICSDSVGLVDGDTLFGEFGGANPWILQDSPESGYLQLGK